MPVVFGQNANNQAFMAMPWQNRNRGQNYPNYPNVYQMPDPQLPPPIPPAGPHESIRLSPFGHESVPVPASVAGDSTAQAQPDIESQTPGWHQQNSLDMAILMGNLHSLTSGLQQVMEENKRLSLQIQSILNDKIQDKKETHDTPLEQGQKRSAEELKTAATPMGSTARPLFLSPKVPEQGPGTQEAESSRRPEAQKRAEWTRARRDDDSDDDLRDIDKKDVALPTKYKGDPVNWRHWYTKFFTFLNRRDSRWGKILEAIKSNSQKPYEQDDEDEIFDKVNIIPERLRLKFKAQLYEYLETYTDGLTHSMVTSGGTGGSLEVFRQLCDEGFSGRERHLRKEYRKITHPKQATFETLKKAILDWEQELAQYQAASGKELGEKEKTLCLEDLCPDILQQHLDGKDGLETYGQIKAAIFDYLVNRTRWASSGRAKLNWLGLPEDDPSAEPEQEENFNQQLDSIDWTQPAEKISGEINALVRNKLERKGKGKGFKQQRGGKDQGGPQSPAAAADVEMRKASKTCYECDQAGHIAADCPVRKARVAAGGPERLPRKDKGLGKGGKNQQWPTKQQWGGFYPGPTQTQWNQWFPAPPKNGASAVQPGVSVDTPSVLQSLFQGPRQMSSIVPVGKKPQSVNSFATANPFQALAVTTEPEEDSKKSDMPIIADLQDFIKPARKQRGKEKVKFAQPQCCGGQCGGSHEAGLLENAEADAAQEQRSLQGLAMEEQAKAERNKRRHRKFLEDSQKTMDELAKLDDISVTEDPIWIEKQGVQAEFKESGGIASPTDEPAKGETPQHMQLSEYLNFANHKFDMPKDVEDDTRKKAALSMFNKVLRTGNLMPVTQKQEVMTKAGKFEVMSCIVDSGATVPVMGPETGEAYELLESAASKEGVLYELANNDTLPNLGEKKMAVLTVEGTLRGYGSQCAHVGKALQAVRSLVSSRHAVCFGLGDGTEHVIINKETGEVNKMRDDGINYLQDLLIIPPDKVDEVAKELDEFHRQQHGHADGDGQGFGRPGP